MMRALLLVDVYHHIERRQQYFRRLRAALKPGGRLALIDFRLDAPAGPPRSVRIPAERVEAELKAAGYSLAAAATLARYGLGLMASIIRQG